MSSSVLPFFEKAAHKLAKLQKEYPSHPRIAAWKMALWAAEKAIFGKMTGEIRYVRTTRSGNSLNFAFLLRGGIGDVILNIAWMDALIHRAECPCTVDIYTNTPKICMTDICIPCPYIKNIETLKEKINASDYDVIFDVMQLPKIRACDPKRLNKLSSFMEGYVQKLIDFQSSHASYYFDENQAMGIHYADVMGTFRRGQADFDGSLGLKDSTFTLQAPLRREELSSRFGLNGDYITIQRESGVSSQSLKLWSAAKYTAMLDALCREYPTVPAVLIGKEKNFSLPAGSHGYILDLRGRTNFEEFMTLVRYARLHIGGEGVVPHMRHYLRGGPSLVLFGPSCARQLGYPENSALSGTECPNGCEGIAPAWQEICLKGYDCCRSLEEVTTDQVMDRVRSLL